MLPIIWETLHSNKITPKYALQSESDFYVLTLPYNSVRFVELQHFVDYEKLLQIEDIAIFFPLSLNKPKYYSMNNQTAPNIAYFLNMDDTTQLRKLKESFHAKIKHKPWNFMVQMKDFLAFKGGQLLKAAIIVLELGYEIQHLLKEDMDNGFQYVSPFAFTTYNGFKYHLLGHFVFERHELYTYLDHVDEHNTSVFEHR